MSKFTLEITNTDNAAFTDNVTDELARILRDVASKVASGKTDGKCIDSNGNCVGTFELDVEYVEPEFAPHTNVRNLINRMDYPPEVYWFGNCVASLEDENEMAYLYKIVSKSRSTEMEVIEAARHCYKMGYIEIVF